MPPPLDKESVEYKSYCRKKSESASTSWENQDIRKARTVGIAQSWENKDIRKARVVGISQSWDTPLRHENQIFVVLERIHGGIWYGNVTHYDNPQYCEKFNREFKERVRAFRGYVCFECGEIQSINDKKKLSIHHVHYDKKMCCNGSPQDVVPLCTSCHTKTNHNREYWEDHFTEMIYENDPTGKCFFTKEEMKEYKRGILK